MWMWQAVAATGGEEGRRRGGNPDIGASRNMERPPDRGGAEVVSHGPALWTGEKRSVPAITPDEQTQTQTPEPEPVAAPETGTEVTVDEPKEPALVASSTKGRSKTGG